MNEEEYLKWKTKINKEEYRDQLLDYCSWLITKHTEELNQAVANNQILDHKLDSFFVHDEGCIINRHIMPRQPAPYITFTIQPPNNKEGT